jgi:hypothetical protein
VRYQNWFHSCVYFAIGGGQDYYCIVSLKSTRPFKSYINGNFIDTSKYFNDKIPLEGLEKFNDITRKA